MQNKWEKSGDFTQSNPHNAPRHEVSYLSTTDDFIINKIRIIGYDDGKIGFTIYADIKKRYHFFNQKFKPLESYFFMLMSTSMGTIDLEPVIDKIALHEAFKIINEIANLEEYQEEIQSILCITNSKQNICLPSHETQDTLELNAECIPVKNQLYSDEGYRYCNFDLRITRPSAPVMYARSIFSITQDDGKELYTGVSPEMVAHIIQSIQKRDIQSLVKKLKENNVKGFYVGVALQNGVITDLKETHKSEEIDEENNEENVSRFTMF